MFSGSDHKFATNQVFSTHCHAADSLIRQLLEIHSTQVFQQRSYVPTFVIATKTPNKIVNVLQRFVAAKYNDKKFVLFVSPRVKFYFIITKKEVVSELKQSSRSLLEIDVLYPIGLIYV